MSTQSTPGIDDAGTTDHPSRSDGFVRGLSEAIGGPLGDHAVALDRPAGRERRFWTAARIVLALMLPHARAALGAEVALPGRRLAEQRAVHPVLLHRRAGPVLRRGAQRGQGALRRPPGRVPGADRRLHGRARACRCTRSARSDPSINQGQWFYDLNALVLGAFARGHGGGDPGPAPPTTLGRGDVRAGPGAAASPPPSTGTCSPSGWPRSACYAWARRRPAAGRGAARPRPARRSSGRCSCSGRSWCWPCAPAGGGPRSSPSVPAVVRLAGGEPAGRAARTRRTGTGSSS